MNSHPILFRLAFIAVPVLLLLAGPRDAVLRQLFRRQPLRTWHLETLVIAAFIAVIVLLSGNDPVEWVGFAALVLSHGRNSIMFRLTEAQRQAAPQDPHHVECWQWNTIYFLSAEACWATYFVYHRSWAALCGVVVFVGYSRWRAWYSRRRAARRPAAPSSSPA